jgi:hypothetical protein
MDTEKLANTIHDLNSFLIDVWDWDGLHEFVKHYTDIVCEPHVIHVLQLDVDRKLNARLGVHLAAKYEQAITEIDRVTEIIKDATPFVKDALLEKVLVDISRLHKPEECVKQWRDHIPFHPSDLEYEPTDEELEKHMNGSNEPEFDWYDFYPDHPEPWAYIANDLGYYINRVVQCIQQHMLPESPIIEGVQVISKTARPKWEGSAAELAYLLTELIEADYIIPPPNGRKTGKKGNRAAVAAAIYDGIDICDKTTGKLVTREYFKSLLRGKSPDRGVYRDLFKVNPRSPTLPT